VGVEVKVGVRVAVRVGVLVGGAGVNAQKAHSGAIPHPYSILKMIFTEAESARVLVIAVSIVAPFGSIVRG